MEAPLQRVLDAHHLVCGAVILANGVVVARVGDFNLFGSDGLVASLLGPYGSTEATFNSVQENGMLLPRMWSQGNEFAFVDRIGDSVVVVFGRGKDDGAAQYRLSRAVSRSIQAEFIQ